MDLLIETDIVILHGTPVSPLEGDLGRTAIDFKDLPCEGWHHTLECFVAACKVRVHGTVVFVRRNDGVVCSDLEHMFACLARTSIDRKGVFGVVDGSPIGELGLERGFDLPVLDEVLNHGLEAASRVIRLFSFRNISLLA